jgi:hypothetical protein
MPDPLSVTASVAGLVGLALHGTRLLIDDVNNIRDAPNVLEDLRTDLFSVGSSLESLKAIDESQLEVLGGEICSQSRFVINRCMSVCDESRRDLQRWTKRSRDGKLSWRDKTNIGFFKERRIKAMAKQLQSCKLTLNSVVSTATLYVRQDGYHHRHFLTTLHSYSTIRTSTMTEEIKNELSARQAEMTATISTILTQVGLAEQSLMQMRLTEEDQLSQEVQEDMEGAAWAIEDEVAMLRFSQETMRELISSMQAELAERAAGGISDSSTSVSFGDNNSGFQAGTISGSVSGLSFGKR